MTIAIHQPNFIPYPGYFNKMLKSDLFVYLDHVQYSSGGSDAIINRNKIKTAQGEFVLTVPVLKNSGPNINQVIIDYKQNWVDKVKKTLELSYKKAPYYQEVSSWFYPILDKKQEHLSMLNIDCIEGVKTYLEIQVPSLTSSSLPIDHQLQKDQLLIAIVSHLKGDTYLSGKGGMKYMNLDTYQNHQIKVEFNQFHSQPYPQLGKEFIPNLSILDLLFNVGKEAKKVLLHS